MEESAYQALYTGAYIIVFITALTVTLYLFNSINDFADLAYEFNTNIENNATIINAPVGANRLLTGEEVISYYYNYIKNDLYTQKESNINYIVTINGVNTNELANKSLKGVAEKINPNSKYILYYKGAKYIDGKKNINIEIKAATQRQIDAIL